MSSTRTSTRVRRALAVTTVVATGALGVVGVAPVAQAVSAATTYSCATNGSSVPFSVTVDTTAPARMAPGASVAISATASTVLPAGLAAVASSEKAVRFDGTIAAKITAGAATFDTTPVISTTPLPSPPADVPFTATSPALPFTAPTVPGPVAITAEGFVATIKFYNAADAVTRTVTLTCEVAPPKKPVLVDTINVVASSTTALVLDRTSADFGQDVTATAKVTTSGGAPDGEVAFSVDGGTATSVRVDKDGGATFTLVDPPVGAHTIVATFAPRDAASYDASTTTQSLTVAKARTKVRVPVTGKTTTTVTRVGVKAAGAYDTVPTGKVRIKLQRTGRTAKTIKVRTLSGTGTATAGFGRLQKGRYQVVVVYRGDADHRYVKKTKAFRVTRR